jgi:hypothetical protein
MPTYEGSITTLVTLNCQKDVHCRCKHWFQFEVRPTHSD